MKFEYEVAGLALNCLLTEDKSRFCTADERAKIVKAVAFYLKKYSSELAWQKKASNNAPETAQEKDVQRPRRTSEGDGRAAGGGDDDVDDTAQLFAGIESVMFALFRTLPILAEVQHLNSRPTFGQPYQNRAVEVVVTSARMRARCQ